MRLINPHFLVLVTLIFAAAFCRVLPHMPNFSPVNAIALFAAAHVTSRLQSIVLPLAAVYLSDLFLNNVTYQVPGQPFVWYYPGFYWQYAAYAVVGLMGLAVFRRTVTIRRTFAATLFAGLIFFAVSNLGVWATGSLYPHSLAGLGACFTAALPFYQGTLYGDAVFVALLFGGFQMLQRQIPAMAPLRQPI